MSPITNNKKSKFKGLLCILCFVQVAQSKYNSGNVDNSVQGTSRPYLRNNAEEKLKIKGIVSNELQEPLATPPAPDGDAEQPPAPDSESAQRPEPEPDNNAGPLLTPESGSDKPPAPDSEAVQPPKPDSESEKPPAPDSEAVQPPKPDSESEKPTAPDSEAEQPSTPDGELEKPDSEVDKTPAQDGDAENPLEPMEFDKDKLEDEYAGSDEPNNNQYEEEHCWYKMISNEIISEIYEMKDTREGLHEEFRQTLGGTKFDKKMLNAMLKTRSVAERALHRFRGEPGTIPAGLNLGGYCMMRMPQSILFFHRLKLRNNTHFRIDYLHNDLKHLTLNARLSLNDLHLTGNYERAITYKDPSTLFYRPTYGQVEFLLKDVQYSVQGRYRLLQDRLHVENIITKLTPTEILMRFTSEKDSKPIKLKDKNIDEYLLRMHNDLDWWLKDYFNDFLMFFGLSEAKATARLQKYENGKTILLNRFMDDVIKRMRRRLRKMNAVSVKIPHFNLFAVNGLEIRLKNGVIRGLESLYRRSVTTGVLDNITTAETTIGFSNLKVEYKYDTFLINGVPPLSGLLVLNADELTARMSVTTTASVSTFIGLDIRFLQETKAQSLTVEGPANRVIANFKHLLEHQIVAIMSSSLINYMHQLSSLNRCHPLFIVEHKLNYGDLSTDELNSNEDAFATTPKTDSEEADAPKTKRPRTDALSDDQDNIQTYPPLTDQYDEPPESPRDSDEDNLNEKPMSGNEHSPTYIVSKNESVELQFPPKRGSKKGETMLLNVKEKFSLTRLKKGKRRTQ